MGSSITVLAMTTLTFKVSEPEARSLRLAARREHLTLSEFLRRQIRAGAAGLESVQLEKCPATGAMIFSPDPQASPLTTAAVKEMLADFP